MLASPMRVSVKFRVSLIMPTNVRQAASSSVDTSTGPVDVLCACMVLPVYKTESYLFRSPLVALFTAPGTRHLPLTVAQILTLTPDTLHR